MKLFAAVVIGVAIGAGIAVLVAAREQDQAVARVVAAGEAGGA